MSLEYDMLVCGKGNDLMMAASCSLMGAMREGTVLLSAGGHKVWELVRPPPPEALQVIQTPMVLLTCRNWVYMTS